MAKFQPIKRNCVVCKADLSAKKKPEGWRSPEYISLHFAVHRSAKHSYSIERAFCPGCISHQAISVDVDILLENNFKVG